MSTNEEEYIEIAIRVKKSDFNKMPKDTRKKMWNQDDPIIHISIDCEVIAFGIDGFISNKLDV